MGHGVALPSGGRSRLQALVGVVAVADHVCAQTKKIALASTSLGKRVTGYESTAAAAVGVLHKGSCCFVLTSLGLGGRRRGDGFALPTKGGADLSTKHWCCGCVFLLIT